MQLRPSRTFIVEPALPPALEPLRAIVANLYWAWSPEAIALFQQMSPELWEASGRNPVRMLQLFPAADLQRVANDPSIVSRVQFVDDELRRYLDEPPESLVAGTSKQNCIAYFSLEFALTSSLPVYSGGLGVLAGDHLKSASDLGLPLVGVSLLYRQGYFQQVLAPDGWQREEYHDIDLAAQALRQVRDDAGRPLTVTVAIADREVRVAIWRLEVGRLPLFLLDSDVEGNSPEDRAICSRVYGGDIGTRLEQEMLLGIGGVRALHAMDLLPFVGHMNEGHSAFKALERIRMLMEETGLSFAEARLPISAATVFTTHTAVAAGIDLFPPELVRKHLSSYYAGLGLNDHEFLGLGRMNADDDTEPFSMALLGLRLSGYRNGVSKLHGEVSRRLWEAAWPNLPYEQVPIGSITNGVHLPTWVSYELGNSFDRVVGPQWRQSPCDAASWQRVHEIAPQELWDIHSARRRHVVERARRQHRDSSAHLGIRDSEAGGKLDPDALTIGFARRFAAYKRATLLFRDPDRLAEIVNRPGRPVQFIFAGKAHPRDDAGKQLIREVMEHCRRPEFRDRLVVLERYDLDLAADLVQGSDVWLNTPLRPLEASGTSGMKAVANGALHLSILDGWWAEAFQPGFGWAIGDGGVSSNPDAQDIIDSDALYTLLEEDVVPAFYDRDASGLPHNWIEKMKGSIAAYAPIFNTNRMVAEYSARAYAPAAASFTSLRADGGALARTLAAWLARVRAAWGSVKVFAVDDDAPPEISGTHSPVTVRVAVHPGALSRSDFQVDIVIGVVNPEGIMTTGKVTPALFESAGEDGVCRFVATLEPNTSGRGGYAVRIRPNHPDLDDPNISELVLWA